MLFYIISLFNLLQTFYNHAIPNHISMPVLQNSASPVNIGIFFM